MVADGLSIVNADFSEHVVPGVPGVDRGAQLPRQPHRLPRRRAGRVTTACSRTKVLVPIDGKVREGVGLLGSPSFEIPRTVERDSTFDHLAHAERAAPPPRRQEPAQPRHHGAVPAGAVVLRLRGHLLIASAAADLYPLGWGRGVGRAGHRRSLAVQRSSTSCWSSGSSTGFRPLRPQFCSIYDPHFWRHERFWKVPAATLPPGLQRHAVQERDLAAAGRPDRPPGLRRRLLA